MNTQEKNRLIAEFMNFPTKELGGRLTDGALINICKYHTSWDWLMPVVEKIGNENYLSFDIEDTYNNVVEHIKWYNENK